MHKNQPYYVKTNNVLAQKRVSTMIYYLFPRASLQVNNRCKIQYSTHLPAVCYSFSLCHYLNEILNIVSKIPIWNQMCLQTHPYSHIEHISKVKMPAICYELMELYYLMNFSWESFSKINSLHLGNGQSVAAIQHIRKRTSNHHSYDQYMVLEQHSLNAFMSFTRASMDLTFCEACKGTEYENALELFKQLCVVFCVQKRKGTCIVKYGETFTHLSLEILTLLSHFYEKTYFVKPSACILTSGEKYLVCKGFVYESIGDKMFQTFFHMYKSILECPPGKYIEHILQPNIPMFLWARLEEINSIFGQPRLEQMNHLLNSYVEQGGNGGMWNNMETKDMSKCREWCEKHGL